ncbi:DUF4007 family protein [Marivirga sp.]|uniref:DUF4007 family protein n=1 Tax=Marivirga sp. TaxID=2018662 RepID=UPI002D7F21CE|nr:DUF4007 family protein [Marivirga sp.]HET8859540.1 DUF4007 family protein [Marivirga sp.]
MSNLIFSGHDTFHCRQFWLKKGYDFINKGMSFNDDNAVLELGIGKNMVSAVRFWMKAFGLVDKNETPYKITKAIFDDNGWDPYLEDEGTLWLLHYFLIKSNYSSIYSILFTELRKVKPEFNNKNLQDFVARKYSEYGSFNKNTLKKDFDVFVKLYLATKNEKDLEENLSGILTELNLVDEIKRGDKHIKLQSISSKKRQSLPPEIILFAIISDDTYGQSISFQSLYSENGIGNIFAIDQESLYEKLQLVSEKYKNIILSNEAGIVEIQFREQKPSPFQVLKSYYEG